MISWLLVVFLFDSVVKELLLFKVLSLQEIEVINVFRQGERKDRKIKFRVPCSFDDIALTLGFGSILHIDMGSIQIRVPLLYDTTRKQIRNY